jgi:hypothetical protein
MIQPDVKNMDNVASIFKKLGIRYRKKIIHADSGGRSLAGIAGSNPAGAWMSVSCDCCVLLGRVWCV